MSRVTVRTPVRRWSDGRFVSRPDVLAGEEPLEIRLDGTSLSVTMRTPGHDVELVHGFLHAEGIIAGRDDVATVRYCDGLDESGANTYNVVDVTTTAYAGSPGPTRAVRAASPSVTAAQRTFVTSSACGVCGKASIEALATRMRHQPAPEGPIFDPQTITALPERLRAGQRSFRSTGGLHAAALVAPDGMLTLLREDVGRHNAVDKVLGAALLADRIPLSDVALLTSSRASFELVQKALMAGIGMLIAISAPSSLAVELAADRGLTLLGFVRETGFNTYTAPHRIRGAV